MTPFGLVQGANGVAETGGAVDLHQGGLLRRSGIAVGSQHRDRLLQRQDVLEFRVRRQRIEEALLDRAGIAKHAAEPICKELLEDRAASRLIRHGYCSSRKILVKTWGRRGDPVLAHSPTRPIAPAGVTTRSASVPARGPLPSSGR